MIRLGDMIETPGSEWLKAIWLAKMPCIQYGGKYVVLVSTHNHTGWCVMFNGTLADARRYMVECIRKER